MELLKATIAEVAVTNPKMCVLLALWERKRGARALPARGDFSWDDLRPWFGNLVLVDVVDGGSDFRYRLWGTELAQFLGYDLTGKLLSEVTPWLGPNPMTEYRQVCRTGAPYSVLVRVPDSKRHVRIDKLNLPLAADGRQVDKVMASIYPAD